jgi:hypothetical protein
LTARASTGSVDALRQLTLKPSSISACRGI